MEAKIDCCVVGDAMVDILFSLTNSDDINYILHGGAISTKSVISAGGTANVAVDIAQLGGISAFIGKVGDDCFGSFFKNDLHINGVKSCLAFSEEYNTGVAVTIILPNKERFFIVDRGANAYLEMEEVDMNLCLSSKYLYICGYSFQDKKTMQTVKSIIKEVYGKVNIVFNPAAPNLAKKYREEFLNLIKRYVDVLILNKREWIELTDNKDNFEDLLSYVDIIVLTKSGEGSTIATQNRVYNIKPHTIKEVDTTGAGDAYAAGFIYGLSRGWDIHKTGNFASKIAGIIVSKIGPRCDLSKFKISDGVH